MGVVKLRGTEHSDSMMTSQLRMWENRLQAYLGKQAKTRPDFRVTLIEMVDEAALWLDPFADLHPEFAQLDFEGLITRYPVLGCAAASEIGFRFEGCRNSLLGEIRGPPRDGYSRHHRSIRPA
jgi:hypothetical protein